MYSPGRGPQTSRMNFDDACGEALEEGTVVRDEHDGAGVARQEVLEPRDGVEVEVMVGSSRSSRSGCPTSAARARRGGASRQTACRRWRRRKTQSRQDEIDVVFADRCSSSALWWAWPWRTRRTPDAGGERDVLLELARGGRRGSAPDRAGVGTPRRRGSSAASTYRNRSGR